MHGQLFCEMLFQRILWSDNFTTQYYIFTVILYQSKKDKRFCSGWQMLQYTKRQIEGVVKFICQLNALTKTLSSSFCCNKTSNITQIHYITTILRESCGRRSRGCHDMNQSSVSFMLWTTNSNSRKSQRRFRKHKTTFSECVLQNTSQVK